MKAININEDIWVELNELGWKYMKVYFEDLFLIDSRVNINEYINLYKKETRYHDINGEHKKLTKFMLHDFMHIFGKHLYVGCDQFIVENMIYMDL